MMTLLEPATIRSKHIKWISALIAISGLLQGCQQSSRTSSAAMVAQTADSAGVGSPAVASTAISSTVASVGASNNAAPTSSTTNSLEISGSPSSTAYVGVTYNFRPILTTSQNQGLAFTILNLPRWATFNVSTGALSGTPSLGDVGITQNIMISVGDGTSTANLAPFSLSVSDVANHNVSISWEAPNETAAGSAVQLGGYRIYYGTSADSLTNVIEISDAKSVAYEMASVPSGTWYFSVTAFDSNHVESSLSDTQVVSL